jgi:hypothetical protein
MSVMQNGSVRYDSALIESARRGAQLPPETGFSALVRYALAKLAGWPEDASRAVARIPLEARES